MVMWWGGGGDGVVVRGEGVKGRGDIDAWLGPVCVELWSCALLVSKVEVCHRGVGAGVVARW